MKLISVIQKSIKEQVRNFWVFILTVSMAPFFVFVYYLINETAKPQYDILILNNDKGSYLFTDYVNYGNYLIDAAEKVSGDTQEIPLRFKTIQDKSEGILLLQKKKFDAMIIIPSSLTDKMINQIFSGEYDAVEFEMIGDVSDVNYIIASIWGKEIIDEFITTAAKNNKLVSIKETSLIVNKNYSDFDLYLPGLLILSLIMLMFTATIAVVTEVENKTIIRLKLSKVSSFQLLTGISIIQVLVGFISLLLTLAAAVSLGFEFIDIYTFGIMMIIAILTSLSIIAFSLIIAAITKTVNEVLIAGNFPLFLFMFFTGAAFPMEGKEIFSIAGYSISLQGLMSPTHSIIALKKIMILGANLTDVIPELISVIILTIIYFAIGVWAFNKRHLRVG
ncbi:MAG: ABC transporter permease [Melioribacteraceae bacterium]|nr:ABC transporter permease [Melioribacteraceae bacterium]MCF8353013.1 ABC transporter permease [Melioribacteraceae bacterium]MCF8392904.1 ABC transporter permease [Melioribacteraceae bacterium]MCF8417802.1 ABC transporter permease [Melioribacteraceae bacterium]